MSAEIAVAFQELFYGSGAWLGILLLLSIIIGLSLKEKYAAVMMLPVCIFLGIDYITNDLLWNALIMFFSSIFIVFNLARNKKG